MNFAHMGMRQNVRLGEVFDDSQNVVTGALNTSGGDPLLGVVLKNF
jgi:hypothetical protein